MSTGEVLDASPKLFGHIERRIALKKDGEKMKRIVNLAWALRIWKDTRGQDLIEYALMAGFVAVAAGAIMPNVASSISSIFSKVGSVLSAADAAS